MSRTAGLLAFLLLVLSALYVTRGVRMLTRPSSADAKDLKTLWTEERWFLKGGNPYGAAGGGVIPSAYPPWAFPANILFYWPDWPRVRLWWAGANLVALWFFMRWAGELGRPYGWIAALLLALAAPAIASVSTGLGLGQNALVYSACLLATMLLAERGGDWLSGVALGIALSKISLCFPFLFPFLFARRWKILIAAGAYIVLASLLTAAHVHVSPVSLFSGWILGSKRLAGAPYGPTSLLVAAGVPLKSAALSSAAIALGGAALATWWLPQRRLLTPFGVAAAAGRLWTYHRSYDNFVLVFLLIALLQLFLRSRRSLAGVAFLAVGVTLWMPPRLGDSVIVQLLHVLVWATGAVVLTAVSAGCGPALPESSVPAAAAAQQSRG